MVRHNVYLICTWDEAETRRDARGAVETQFGTRMGRDRQSHRDRPVVISQFGDLPKCSVHTVIIFREAL